VLAQKAAKPFDKIRVDLIKVGLGSEFVQEGETVPVCVRGPDSKAIARLALAVDAVGVVFLDCNADPLFLRPFSVGRLLSLSLIFPPAATYASSKRFLLRAASATSGSLPTGSMLLRDPSYQLM
jgi:hypothetical protein